ncbi:pirin family protein [Thiohalocapsa marina]|uniref:pirin family protein n=1 Tax=Thiohalocapsa marina TaxID=424902 RepID=UPI0036DDA45D
MIWRPAAALRQSRTVERLITGQPTMDGAGVRLTRVLTQDLQRRLDPFLMLDNFDSDKADDYIAGFPEHPHRGFETVTYMIAGRMRHRDSAGHEGLLENGGVQWMTAGRGIVHSEIPQQEAGVMEGFQLWLNLPARDKMRAPWYRDFAAADLPRFRTGSKAAGTEATGAEVVLIAGESHGLKGAMTRAHTEPLFLDIHLDAQGRFAQPLPADHNAFVYVYRGEARIGDTRVPRKRMAILDNAAASDGVLIEAATENTRVLLLAGRPLNEPIVQHGPFVMNSRQEIYQAIMDFQQGHLTNSKDATGSTA